MVWSGMKRARRFWCNEAFMNLENIKWQWNGYDEMDRGIIYRIEDHNEIADDCGFDRSEYTSEDFNDYLQDYLLKRNSPRKGWQHLRFSDYLEYR